MNTSLNPDDVLGTAIEEYLTRLDSGDQPNPEDYLSRFPQCEDDLRAFFENMGFLDEKLAEARAVSEKAGLGRWFKEDELQEPGAQPDVEQPIFPQIRGFRILDELGKGSQGIVYQAEQLGTGRIAALKIIREGVFASIRERRRFENEVQVASRLQHPNIVSVYECGNHAGRDYYAMEFVEGQSLDQYVLNSRPGIADTVRLFLQIVDAVSYAHQRGVMHRDLKPSNILVDANGTIHILDFGLAKRIDEPMNPEVAAETRIGEFAGTLCYASPEQLRRDPNLIDVRSDVYSLGVILFELLSGKFPYPMDDAVVIESIARHILDTPPFRLRSFRRDINDDLETIVQCALEKDAQLRYQSAVQFADDLRNFLAGYPITAKRHSGWYLLKKSLRRYRWQAAGVAVSVLALLVFTVVVFVLYFRATSAEATTSSRMGIVRRGQVTLGEKSYEANRNYNWQREIAATIDMGSLLRPVPPTIPIEWPAAWSRMTSDLPDRVFQAIRATGDPARPQVENWLQQHEEQMNEIAVLLRQQPVRVVVKPSGEEKLLASLSPDLIAAVTLCEAYTARAWQSWHERNHENSLYDLDTARAIALDMADGPLLHHKTNSLRARSVVYEALFNVLHLSIGDSIATDAYVSWILRDPPLVEFRPAFTDELFRKTQICEAVTIGRPGDPAGFLDMEALRKLWGPLFNEQQTPTKILSDEVLDLIDFYITEVETWDSLKFAELQAGRERLREKLHSYANWNFVSPLFPNYGAAFEERGRLVCQREALRVCACLLRHRGQHDRWPTRLDELALDADVRRVSAVDPYTGITFGYQLTPNGPVLYSVGEDLKDNGGIPGDWNQSGADVILFPPTDSAATQ